MASSTSAWALARNLASSGGPATPRDSFRKLRSRARPSLRMEEQVLPAVVTGATVVAGPPARQRGSLAHDGGDEIPPFDAGTNHIEVHDDQGDQGQTAPPGPGRSALPSYPAALTPKGPNPPHHHPRPPVEALLRHPGGRFSGRPMSSASARRCRPGEVAVNGGAGHTEKVGDLLHGLVAGVAQLLGEGP